MDRRVMLGVGLFLCPLSVDQLPDRFTIADKNANGEIEIEEVQKMIDGFFIGLHNKDAMYMHELIDYYFVQDLSEMEK